jgi:hypothetical protein
MVECKDCVYFARRPGDTVWKRKTGCYHPDNMEQTQSEAFLSEQEVPGDHRRINADGDCGQYEARPERPSLLVRLARAMRA